MVDTNNNGIGTFGKYGNQDSGGPNAKVNKPENPLAWPTYVAVGDDYSFVNATVSNRALSKLNYILPQKSCAKSNKFPKIVAKW